MKPPDLYDAWGYLREQILAYTALAIPKANLAKKYALTIEELSSIFA